MNSPSVTSVISCKNPLRQDIWRGKLGVLQLEYAVILDHQAHAVLFGPCTEPGGPPRGGMILTPDEATTLGTALESAGLKLKGIFSPQIQERLPMTEQQHNRYPNGRYQHV